LVLDLLAVVDLLADVLIVYERTTIVVASALSS
jgi:hypothetical protein